MMMLAQTALELGDYAVIGGLVAAGTGVTLAFVKSLAARLARLESRVNEFERDKAGKAEWARETILTRRKLDKLAAQNAEIAAKLDANFGVAANVGRLVDELARLRKSDRRDEGNVHGQ